MLDYKETVQNNSVCHLFVIDFCGNICISSLREHTELQYSVHREKTKGIASRFSRYDLAK